MLWVFLALMSSFVWAGANILDKVLRTRYLRDSVALTASFGIFSIVFSFILFIFIGIPAIAFQNLLAALIAGIIIAYAVIFYIKALSIEEASRVIPLWHLSPLFTLILAVIFLNEILTFPRYAAFALIFLGGFLISTRRIGSILNISPAAGFMLLSSLLSSISDVLMKFAFNSQMFWKTFLVFYFGVSIGSLSLFFFRDTRKKFYKAVSIRKNIFIIVLFLSVLLGFVGNILYTNAILLGPVTLVGTFISFQSLFVLLIATFLSIRFPLFIKESIGARTIGIKLIAIAFMGIGLFLLAL